MFVMKHVVFLIFITIGKTHIVDRYVTTNVMIDGSVNSSYEQSVNGNASTIVISPDISSSVSLQNQVEDSVEEEPLYDNKYAEKLPEGLNATSESFHHGPQYEANWTFIDKETVRVEFSLYSISKLSVDQQYTNDNDSQVKRHPTIVSIPLRSIQSIYSLKYFLFTIRQYKTNIEKVLPLEPLILKSSPARTREFLSNTLLLLRLNPKEKYSICIYYYTSNASADLPDIFMCQDVMHDHLKHSGYRGIFVITQYSIILGFLVILQILFTMRKRRIAQIVHRHLVNKAQRLRTTLSSVSLARQTSNPGDATAQQKIIKTNGQAIPEKNILKKRIISSPAIVLSDPTVPLNKTVNNTDENEPFLKLSNGKNHVHFLLGLDEESDNEDENEDENINNNDNDIENTAIDLPLNSPLASRLLGPYGDRSDAILSMAHILDINKPWSRQS